MLEIDDVRPGDEVCIPWKSMVCTLGTNIEHPEDQQCSPKGCDVCTMGSIVCIVEINGVHCGE